MIRTRFAVSCLASLMALQIALSGCAADAPESAGSAQVDRDSAKALPRQQGAEAEDAAVSSKLEEVDAAEATATAKPSAAPARAERGRVRGIGGQPVDTEAPIAGDDSAVNGKAFSDMFFKHYGVNPTIDTAEEDTSTFAVDVDTAAYAMTRSYLDRGAMPDDAAVRVEEVINYFDYHYEAPGSGAFSMHAEAFPSPNRDGFHVLHIGLKGKEIKVAERKSANLVFVIDVSGSMDQENRLGLVKDSLRMLVDQLDERDSVGIVVYGSTARTVLEPTNATRKANILRAIDSLSPEGSTNAEAGLKLGYQVAATRLAKGTNSRVILCSDGVANTGSTSADAILAKVAEEAGRGITISALGFGMGNYNDVLMEQLADKGNGNYSYIDGIQEANRVFVENLTGTLQVIAKDVKVQVEFDDDVVSRYRLLGYENRVLANQEFSDDRKDAGEIGAGHSVTAMYEVKFKRTDAENFGKLRVRFKQPKGSQSEMIERNLPSSMIRDSFARVSSPTKLSLVAATFAEKLRGSYWVRNLKWEDIIRLHDQLATDHKREADVAELRRLILRAASLDERDDKFEKDMPIAQMTFDRVPVLE